jgi:hypothetical protein
MFATGMSFTEKNCLYGRNFGCRTGFSDACV